MQNLFSFTGQEFTDFLVFWGVWQGVKVLKSSVYPLHAFLLPAHDAVLLDTTKLSDTG